MDHVVRAPRLPAPGETILGGPRSLFPGGKGANQAVGAARLGAAVSMLGAVGDDEAGRTLLAELAAGGVDAGAVRVEPGEPTGAAIITVADGGQNTIVVMPGANARVTPEAVRGARGIIAQADMLLVQLELPVATAVAAVAVADEVGTPVLLNAAPGMTLPMELISRVETIVVNEVEAGIVLGLGRAIADDEIDLALDRLLSLGPTTAVITLGEHGAALRHDKEPAARVPACQVAAVDAVGAGDAFTAALAVRLAEHRAGARVDHLAVLDAVCWGCAAGALATTTPGAMPSLPGRAAVAGLLRSQPG
ncbi:MAG: ribokinase [Phycisphaerae bacterium]|nr:ribokinase [Phycisphaerae bacterium]